jgi:hypothetical protein
VKNEKQPFSNEVRVFGKMIDWSYAHRKILWFPRIFKGKRTKTDCKTLFYSHCDW